MEEFKFRMSGPMFEDGIPLHITIAAMQDVQSIFDKSYLQLSGKRVLGKKDRREFFLRTFDIKHGSLDSDLQIVVEHAQVALPFLAPFASADVWDLTVRSWEFLKYVFSNTRESGKPTSYEAHDDGRVVVISGDNNKVFMNDAVQTGISSAAHWRSLNHKLKQGEIDSYSLGSPEAPQIHLESPSREIFDHPSIIEPTPVSFFCDIFGFNKRDNVGKLSVIKGDLPISDYTFEVVGDQDRVDYISSMIKPEVKVSALKEVVLDPLGETIVKKLHVTEVDSAA